MTEAMEWQCAGCGVMSPNKVSSCDCATNVVTRGREQAWKSDQTSAHSAEAVAYAFKKASEILIENGWPDTAAILASCNPTTPSDPTAAGQQLREALGTVFGYANQYRNEITHNGARRSVTAKLDHAKETIESAIRSGNEKPAADDRNLLEEGRIDRLRLAAFKTNDVKDRQLYFDATSKWFQDRHYRRMSISTALGVQATGGGEKPDRSEELLGNLPLQYFDGPDYCTVKDATGGDFALTVQPELMKLMECSFRSATTPPAAVPEAETVKAIVEEAMLDGWNDICSDTECHPLDIKQCGSRRLEFKPNHWSSFTGERAAHRILALLSPASGKTAEEDRG